MADRDAGVPEDERTTFRAFAQRANVVVAVQSPDGLVGLLYRPTMARPINFAAVPTATVNPKNGPKSRVAGMLVMKSPGILVWKCSSNIGKPLCIASPSRIFPRARNGTWSICTRYPVARMMVSTVSVLPLSSRTDSAS